MFILAGPCAVDRTLNFQAVTNRLTVTRHGSCCLLGRGLAKVGPEGSIVCIAVSAHLLYAQVQCYPLFAIADSKRRVAWQWKLSQPRERMEWPGHFFVFRSGGCRETTTQAPNVSLLLILKKLIDHKTAMNCVILFYIVVLGLEWFLWGGGGSRGSLPQ